MAKLRPKSAAGKSISKTARKRSPRRPPVQRARPLTAPALQAIEVALAGIAHDIRTPLTGLVALAELLAASDLGPRERAWAKALKSGADHLALLSTLIVDAVKADAAGLVLRHEQFAPRALAEAVGQALSARAGTKSVKAVIEIASDLPATVVGDALRLRAALENLADNAVKFTGEGAVTFRAAAEPATRGRLRLVFTLSDSGIGMSPADIKRLFRPFSQASDEVARRYGGAGLGLTFVKRLAKAMGGDLTVTSKPGQGSTFRLTVLVTPALAVDHAGPPTVRSGRALTVLCVEDNPYGRVVMNTILTELGHAADFVDNGEAAVKAVARGGYDVVLMDVTLADVDGLEATRRIRALPDRAADVTVIGMSGHDDAITAKAAREAGMNDYLVKPVSPKQLAAALASISAHPYASADLT
ncbi:MAG: response regulator [Rhodopseudomonas sp.]|nr:response regulator [Rhodopseudomonas sp.]